MVDYMNALGMCSDCGEFRGWADGPPHKCKQKKGKALRQNWISRKYVQSHRHQYFVFGDNMIGKGYAGQAASMRGESNTIGIPTKHTPGRDPRDYFCDADWQDGNVRHAIFEAFNKITAMLDSGHDVIFPTIGTGLAALDKKSPLIFNYIQTRISDIFRRYGEDE